MSPSRVSQSLGLAVLLRRILDAESASATVVNHAQNPRSALNKWVLNLINGVLASPFKAGIQTIGLDN